MLLQFKILKEEPFNMLVSKLGGLIFNLIVDFTGKKIWYYSHTIH